MPTCKPAAPLASISASSHYSDMSCSMGGGACIWRGPTRPFVAEMTKALPLAVVHTCARSF